MKLGLRWRVAIALIVTVVAVIYALPSLPSVKASALGRFLPDKEVNLGLDLKGGINLTLGVDVDKAVEVSLAQTGQAVRMLAEDKGIYIMRPRPAAGFRLEFVLPKSEKRAELDALLKESFGNLQVLSVTPLANGQTRYTVAFTDSYRKNVADMALDQAVRTIRSRIDEFGVTEPEIRKQQQGYRIQVQLPGLQDPKRAMAVIGKTGHLEFRLVRDDVNPRDIARGVLPPGTEALVMVERRPGAPAETVVLDKDALMTGENVADARLEYDEQGRPAVGLNFDSRGAVLFERVTGQHIGHRVAIVLDGKVYSAPVIKNRIPGGRASISGGFSTIEEARDLALVLRAGSLPAPVTILEERTVGPSLGQDSINKGVMAAILGGVLVAVFMIVYYGFSGFIADIALALNLVLIIAGMAAFGATLTLPGIAGIVLTLGMAVDANVLINERLREELKLGLTPKKAVSVAYERATLTIVDANVTTIMAAVILYQFGTGPIKGFAVTLSLGIIASMFTAVFVTHVLFDLWNSLKRRETLSV